MSGSCVMRTIVFPSSFRAWKIAITSSDVFVSRFPVGSSARTIAGSFTRLRAIATRCCWPPESCAEVWSQRSARPTRARHARAFCSISASVGCLERE